MAVISSFAPDAAAELVPGAYFTDGHNLFAILAVSPEERHEAMITYEDCRTFEMLVCPLRELSGRRLELVRAGER